MMVRLRALVISFSDLGRDPRVDRQIRWLHENCDVVAAGLGRPGIEGVEFIDVTPRPISADPIAAPRTRIEWLLFTLGRVRNIPRRAVRYWRSPFNRLGMLRRILRWPGQYERVYWSAEPVITALRVLDGVSADLVVANDIDALPLAHRVARGAPVVFDAHEYAPGEYDENKWFRLHGRPYRKYLCRTYIPRSAAMTTVCEGIAAAYERDTGVRPVVVTNAAHYEPLTPRIVVSDPERIRLVHHGLGVRVRRLEKMIDMMRHLDNRFELSLMFAQSEPDYLAYLKDLARTIPNVHFLPPVPMRELARFTNQFDVGVFVLEPLNFNNLHALPNKFFEYIQARLAIAIGPSPEMVRIVRKYDLGVIAPDWTPLGLAAEFQRLDRAAIERYKRNAHECARELSAERNAEIMRSVVERVTGVAARDTSLAASA
jgi:hypothetical protein